MGAEVLAGKNMGETAPRSPKTIGKEPNLKVIKGTLEGPSIPTPREKLVLVVNNTHGGVTVGEPLWPRGFIPPDRRDIDEVNSPERVLMPRVTGAEFRAAQAVATNKSRKVRREERREAKEIIERYHAEHADPVMPKKALQNGQTETDVTKDSEEYDPKKDPQLRQRGQIHTDLALKAVGVLAAVGIAVGGCWAAATDFLKPKPTATPSPTPYASPSATGGMPSASPFETQTPGTSPSVPPSPEPSPTLDLTMWYDLIPESPYTSVDDVPLYKDSGGHPTEGNFQMAELTGYTPDYTVRASGLTLLSATPDIKNNQIILEVTTGVDTIQQKSCSGNMCDLTGGSFRVILKQGDWITQGSNPLGTNLNTVAPLLVPGAFVAINITFGKTPAGDSVGITTDEQAANRTSWTKYRNEVGQKAAPRTASDLLTFTPYSISVFPPNPVTPSPTPSPSSIS